MSSRSRRALTVAHLLLLASCGNGTPPAPEAGAPAASSTPIASASAPESAPIASASADVVANASEKYVPGPSVIASGGVDGAALRKRHVERLKSDTSPVTILKGTGPLDLGKRICEAVVPKRPAATPVLLKPNLCGFDSIKDPEKSKGDDGVHGRTTDVEFTRGVVQCLKARGHTKITIAEGCGISHKHWQNVIRLTGYDAMARQEAVSLVAMDDDGVFDTEGDQPGKPLAIKGIGTSYVPTLLLPKVLAEHLDHGLFISLPRIKAHRYSVVSLSIKGGQGTVMMSDSSPAYKQKWRMHKELGDYLDSRKSPEDAGTPADQRKFYMGTLIAFAQRMADVLEISTPDAVLCDGAPAMGGDGFQKLRPSNELVAVGGTNPVAVDRVGAAFLGLWNNPGLSRELGGYSTSPLITIAAKRYGLDLSKTVIAGDGASLLESPRPYHFKAMVPFALDWDPPGAPPVGTYVFPTADKPALPPSPAPDTSANAPASATVAPPPPAPPPAPAPAPSSNGRPEAHAAALATDAITIDGKADDAAWSRATPVAWATDYAGNASAFPTRARFLWSKAGLHVLFEVLNAGLRTDTSQPVDVERKGLYQEDCVEVFLAPDPARRKHYYEIELGPFGHFFDIEVDREKGKQNTAWSSAVKIAAKRGTRTATIEALLAAPEIAAALTAGARLPMGLYRMEGGGDRHYLAWSPPRTEKPNFHVPDAFGTLVIDP